MTNPTNTPSASFWTIARLANALHQRLRDFAPHGDALISGISTDTRAIQPGHCFVALSGERFDAHDFLGDAVNAGAAALVVSQPVALRRFSVPVFHVDDTLLALGDLARYRRVAWGRPVIGVAGSNGKTSTKELIRAALGGVYEVHSTTGNLNNRVGVPLTLLSLSDDADIAVVEIGTSLPGEVATLRNIVLPDVAVITSVGEEHLEGLGDLAGVFREELSICDGVPLIITPSIQPEIGDAARRKAPRVITTGLDDGDMHADAWSVDTEGQGRLTIGGTSITPAVRGIHNLRNTMLALAVAREFGVPMDAVACALSAMPVPSMRASWQRTGRAMVINDAYNANPGSARAALAMLDAAHGAQRVAILGTMRELGPNAAQYHDEIARAALQSSADLIAGIGDFASAFQRIAAHDARVITAPNIDDLWRQLMPRLAPDATILLKASRGVQLERILPHIATWATA